MAVKEDELARRRKTLAKNVHMMRWERDWSLGDLERASGVPASTLSRIEKAKGKVNEEYVRRVAAALGVTPDVLYGYSDNPVTPGKRDRQKVAA